MAFNFDEAEFYRKRTRQEPPLDQHLLNANIQLQDECKDLKNIIKRTKKYVTDSSTITRKMLLNLLNGKIE